MSDEGDVGAPTTEVAAAAPSGIPEPIVFDETSAVKEVLKKALVYDGLARGLREATHALEKGQATLVLLAQDCTEAAYKQLIDSLAAEQGVNLLHVPSNKDLGEWAGLRKLDAQGNARKVVSCSCVVVKNYGENSDALTWLLDFLKNKQ